MTQACPACGTAIDTTDAEPLARVACPRCGEKMRVERTFDHFVLLETLGLGGMGTVYKARDTLLDRFVALKLLRRDLSGESDHASRLQQEARVAASINHPNVIQVFSSGTDHGQFYVVMELVNRGSLDDLIEQRNRLSEGQVLESGIQVAKGLRAAHRQGLIHRDVKPANILFIDEQTAKISDFGLASAAVEGTKRDEIWGTPYYVAPERLNNGPEDFRTDIYGLGATLFHAVAGKAPIEGNTNSAALLLDLKNHPLDLRAIAPDVSQATAAVLERMIAPDPAQRFSSYDELVSEMEHAQHTLKGQEHVAVARGRWPRWALAGVVLFIMLAAVAVLFLARKPRPHVATSASPNASVKLGAKDKGPAHRAVNPQPAGAATRAENEKKVLALETAPWNAALSNYREQIALYDFAAARDAIKNVQLSGASLKQAQEATEKRAQWLIDWKNNLIDDINRAHFSGAISDSSGAKFTGIAGATDQSLSLKLPYGIARVTWRELPPKTLLTVSTSFVKPNAPDAADRQWRCAVFASEFGQTEVARQLAEAAVKVNSRYHEQISQLFPPPPQFR
ncbi:MAG TPA: protein kinase [Candidatus Binatus sp.]|nr:protein kinase [Candidatus Binatus sp.]